MDNSVEDALDALLATAKSGEFRAFAHYAKHMDCIRIELRDCSVCEHRVNKWITVLYDNHPMEGSNHIAGLTIKGAHHVFHQLGLSLNGVYVVTKILDAMIKTLFPEEEEAIMPVKDAVSMFELAVDMNQENTAAA